MSDNWREIVGVMQEAAQQAERARKAEEECDYWKSRAEAAEAEIARLHTEAEQAEQLILAAMLLEGPPTWTKQAEEWCSKRAALEEDSPA